MPIPKQPTTPPMPKCVPPKDAWIPYDEMNPPEINTNCLLTIRRCQPINKTTWEDWDFVMAIGYMNYEHEWFFLNDKRYTWEYDVIAWMPCPEPYIPKEETK